MNEKMNDGKHECIKNGGHEGRKTWLNEWMKEGRIEGRHDGKGEDMKEGRHVRRKTSKKEYIQEGMKEGENGGKTERKNKRKKEGRKTWMNEDMKEGTKDGRHERIKGKRHAGMKEERHEWNERMKEKKKNHPGTNMVYKEGIMGSKTRIYWRIQHSRKIMFVPSRIIQTCLANLHL